MLEDVKQYLLSNTIVGKDENMTSFTNVGWYDRDGGMRYIKVHFQSVYFCARSRFFFI